MINGDYDPSFFLGLSMKDLNLANEIIKLQKLKLPIMNLTSKIYNKAIKKYGPNSNHLKVIKLLEQIGCISLMKPLLGKPKIGTYVYRNEDYFYDQIIINGQLRDNHNLSIVDNSLYILDLPKYRQQEGNYKHYPFRFWAGNRLLGGYSDHLAIKVKIQKN